MGIAKWAETSGVKSITTFPSVRHGGASSDALWRTRSLMEIQKRGRWRSEKSVRIREARPVAHRNLEAVRRYAKIWTTVDEPHVAA